MEPPVYQYFLDRLESKKQTVKHKLGDIVDELFGNILHEFNDLEAKNRQKSDTGILDVNGVDSIKVGNCIEDVNTKIHYMLLTTYEEAFADYEQSVEYGKQCKEAQAVNSEIGNLPFEITIVKRRKRKGAVEPDNRALMLMNKKPRVAEKSFYCKWPDCGHSSKNFYNLAKHVRHHHFNLPLTKQEQTELNIVDDRDPLKFVGELTDANSVREIVQPSAEDLVRPEYSRQRKFVCKFANCGRSFSEKQVLVSHEKLHLGLKPFKCAFDPACPFSSLKKTAVRRHIRQKHFHLPKTLKKQAALNLVDPRDPDDYIQEDQAQAI